MTIRSMPSNQNYRDNFDRVFGKKPEIITKTPYPEICTWCIHRGALADYHWCTEFVMRLDRAVGIGPECKKFYAGEP